MNKKASLLERKEQIQKRLDAFLNILNGKDEQGNSIQARSLTNDESTELNNLRSELGQIDNEIGQLDFLENQSRTKATNKAHAAESPEQKVRKRFSVGKALAELRMGRLTGLEAEMHAEGEKIARDTNLPTTGRGFYLPAFAHMDVEKRDSTVAAPLAAGNTISTTQHGLKDGYNFTLGLEQIGLQVIRNLTGINDIPVADLLAEASYSAEGNTSITSIDPNVRRPRLTARQVSAKSRVTFLLKAAADPVLDSIIMQNLLNAEKLAVEKVVIKGGGANQPVGILDSADTQNLDLGSPGNLSYNKIIDLINAPDDENAAFDMNFAFATNAKVRGMLQKIKIDAGSGQMVWDRQVANTLNGYPAFVSNIVPSNGGVGTNESAIIFGNWSQMVLGNWALRELIVDDYSVDSFSIVKLYSFWDQAFLNPKAFAKVRNILTTV
jgi:HK97 family phage major capsid protein